MDLQLTINTFRAVGDDVDATPTAWLHTVLTINGVDHHLEAIAVTDDGEKQRAETAELDEQLELYAEAASANRPFDTVRLDGRDYVLVLTPFAANTYRDHPGETP